MKKPDYRDLKVPEYPRQKDVKEGKKKTTYLDETVKKAENYDLLIGKLKGSKDYLKANKDYLVSIKGTLNIGYRNGRIQGRITEIEDRINWIDSILGRFE